MIDPRDPRLRLALWYGGTFAAVLVLIGLGLSHVVAREQAAELDRFLENAVAELLGAAERLAGQGLDFEEALILARSEAGPSDRAVYLVRTDGSLAAPGPVPPAVLRAAQACRQRPVVRARFAHDGLQWRAHARRLDGTGEPAYAAVAVSDVAEIERQYGRALRVLIGGGLLTLVPIGAGGIYLAGQTYAPALERFRRFTADAVHELRAPLAALRGRTEVTLQNERSPEEYRAALADVAREAERLGTLIDDLLFLARSDAAAAPRPVHEEFYLDDVAVETLESAAAHAANRGVRLEIGRYEEAAVRGDRESVRRLTTALLDNAIKYTPGGRAVFLDVGIDEGRPTVSVRDEGIGIAAADMPHVFDRFYRGADGRAHAGGSGLGLAIVRTIAEQHGARITVRSAPGRGTTVSVAFPPVPG